MFLDNKKNEKLKDCVYYVGFDPKWGVASNKLTYFNSFKMKFAVVVGFFHMGLGILLKALNEIHFKRIRYLFLEVVPQFIFFVSLFGYMTFCIFYKWLRSDLQEKAAKNQDIPSIIQILMDIFLKPMAGKVDKPLYGDEAGNVQYRVQVLILVICLVCIPWMLVPKPLLEYFESHKTEHNYIDLHEEVPF